MALAITKIVCGTVIILALLFCILTVYLTRGGGNGS